MCCIMRRLRFLERGKVGAGGEPVSRGQMKMKKEQESMMTNTDEGRIDVAFTRDLSSESGGQSL